MGLFYLYEMIPLEIKQSGCKLLAHSVLRGGGVFPEAGSRSFQEVGGGRGFWMELAQDRDRWRASSIKCEEFLGYLRKLVSFSRRALLHTTTS
jgi:hypothetical protein